MPALGQLAFILDLLADGGTRTETLVFWTPHGPQTVTCEVHCPDAQQQPDVVLLRGLVSGQTGKITPETAEPHSIFPRRRDRKQARPIHAPSHIKPDTDNTSEAAPAAGQDLDVLQQIAQQIRQQRPTHTPSVAPARAPDKTPTATHSIAVAPAKELSGVVVVANARSGSSDQLTEHDKASLADLGHELRTPLGSISGFADMMITERFGPLGHEKYAGYVRDIQASAGHVLGLIEGFTSRERDSDVAELSFSDIDVNQVADECLSAMRPLAEQAGVRLAGALAARLPRVIADRRSLKQIFLNLLSNATRYTASGGTATLTTSYRPGCSYCIEVRDTGIGMSPELIASVTGESDLAGNGLPVGTRRDGRGLALTSRLVTANGAKLTIESTSGEGTAVQIIVPLDRLVLV